MKLPYVSKTFSSFHSLRSHHFKTFPKIQEIKDFQDILENAIFTTLKAFLVKKKGLFKINPMICLTLIAMVTSVLEMSDFLGFFVVSYLRIER